jgi:hypothetical protein|tara:strand:+ start:240 stop:524 length:285 start_codon:yes stop_codon:yes gene_type:complete
MITKGQKNIMTYKPKYLSNQISLVRDTAYNKIKEIVAASDIVTPKVSEKLDINLKNTVNKILNDYRFQETNKKEEPIDEEPGIWSEFASEGLGI